MRKAIHYLIISALLFSCEKDTFKTYTKGVVKNSAIEEFFKISDSAPLSVKQIIADIRRKEEKSPFLEEFIKENGYPSWENVIMGGENSLSNGNSEIRSNAFQVRGNSSKSIPFVFVPMIDQTTKVVVSFTQCYLFSDTSIKYITTRKKDFLQDYPQNALQLVNRRISASLFGAFEKSISPYRKFSLPAPLDLDYSNTVFKKFDPSTIVDNSFQQEIVKIKSNSTPNNNDIYYIECDGFRIYYIYHADAYPPRWTILHISAMNQIPQSDGSAGNNNPTPPTYYPIFYPTPIPDNSVLGQYTSSGGGNGNAVNYPPGWVSQDPNASPFTPSFDGNLEPQDTDYIPSSLSDNSAWNYIAIGLVNNSHGLIDFSNIPCPTKESWLQLATFIPDNACIEKLNTVVSNGAIIGAGGAGIIRTRDVAKIQNINNAYSAITNMDYYPIKVTSLPVINQHQLSPDEFLQYIRKNMNYFVDTAISSFRAYSHYGIDDNSLWNSSNPNSAIVSISIPFNSGSVITSFNPQNPSKWTFTTITDPYNGMHPVSGNREFGYTVDPTGGYTFYTKGVDRLSDAIGTLVQSTVGTPFNSADNLWKSFQVYVRDFVNANGGASYTQGPVTARPNWDLVRAVLNRTMPISSIRSSPPCL